MALQVGSRLGPYQIEAPIGAGGMGEVYRAVDTKLGRRVAIKILPDSLAADPERIARFEREARTLAAVNHPHIAQVYGVEESRGEHPGSSVTGLVMELVDGEDLAERVAREPVPVDEALTIARQIALALAAAHEQGIIHRDLKPANIKVRPDGSVKVLDFGLAKAVEPTAASPAAPAALANSPTITTPAVTLQGVVLGTAAYMAPEQAKGQPVDRRADIWAFGCVLYELLTGKRAFEGEDVADTLASVLKSEPDWTALPAALPPLAVSLLKRCVERDRRRRIADAHTILFVLDELHTDARSLTGQSVAGLEGRIGADTRDARRRVLRFALPVMAGLAATIGGLLIWIASRPSAAPGLVTRFSVALPTAQQALSALNRGVLAVSDDGRWMAWASSGGIFMRSIAESQASLVPGSFSGLAPHSPAFAPDGTSVAFFSNAQLKRVAIRGGTPSNVCEIGPSFGLNWTAAGIIMGQGPQGVVRCSANGGPAEQLVTVASGEEAYGADLLPDGDTILLAIAKMADGQSRWDKAQIVAQSIKSGQRKVILNGGSDARYVPSGHLLYALAGTLFAVSFDPATQTTRGAAIPVIEGVRRGVAGGAHYAVSNTGTLLYLPGSLRPTSELALAFSDRKGTITRLATPNGYYDQVRASPDGRRLAIGTDDGREAIVFVHELANAPMQRLTLQGKNRFPIWSPSGDRIAFQSDRGGDRAIYVQSVDDNVPAERITTAANDEAHIPESWSPDGRSIAYAVEKSGNYRLMTRDLSARSSTAFANVSSADPIGSSFSPDGKWLLYTSSPETGGAQSPNRGVFVQPVPPTGAVYQVPKQLLDFHPVWSAAGKEIVFTASAASGRTVVMPMTTTPGVRFGSPLMLESRVTGERTSTQMRIWDVLPDGRFIGVVGPADTAASPRPVEIQVVLNWFEELKQRVPAK